MYTLFSCAKLSLLCGWIMLNVVLIQCNTPPNVIAGYNNEYRIKVNEKLQIKCPMKFNPTDHFAEITWSKDKEALTSAANTGLDITYQRNNQILLITKTTLRHSGEYYCDGVNGFGMARATFTVQVYDPNVENLQCNQHNRKLGLPLGAPCFPSGQKEEVKKTFVGEAVTMNCPAVGTPSPSFNWAKSGENKNWIAGIQGRKTSQLQLLNVNSLHEGLYICEAINKHGIVRAQFKLIVNERYEPARIIGPRLTNKTLNTGDSLHLTCNVKAGNNKVVIRWMKLIQSSMKKSYENSGKEIFKYSNELYIVMEPFSEKLKSLGNSYHLEASQLNSIDLKISSVSSENAGKYVCTAIGSQGELDHTTVILNVVSSDNYLIFYISVPLTVFVICFFVMIFCMISRKCNQRSNNLTVMSNFKHAVQTAETYPMSVSKPQVPQQQQQQHLLQEKYLSTVTDRYNYMLYNGTPSNNPGAFSPDISSDTCSQSVNCRAEQIRDQYP